jgi:hypothetical protein
MPTARQRTVDIFSTVGSLGPVGGTSTSDSARLAAIFPGSPIHSGQITPEERRKEYISLSLGTIVNDEGHTFGTVNTDYVTAPDMSEVDLKKHNLPSPYVPNPTSPGAGSQNDVDKPAPPEGFGQTPSQTYGSGVGSRLSPKASSERLARQTLGDYILGKSSGDSET